MGFFCNTFLDRKSSPSVENFFFFFLTSYLGSMSWKIKGGLFHFRPHSWDYHVVRTLNLYLYNLCVMTVFFKRGFAGTQICFKYKGREWIHLLPAKNSQRTTYRYALQQETAAVPSQRNMRCAVCFLPLFSSVQLTHFSPGGVALGNCSCVWAVSRSSFGPRWCLYAT